MHKKLFSLFCIIFITVFSASLIWYNTREYSSTKPGIIILINGPSTSGKSSLKKELQKLYPTPYLNLGIDTLFVGVLPERFVTGPKLDHDIDHAEVMEGRVSHDAQGHRLFTLHIGNVGNDVIHGMHQSIAAYAKTGNDCIVDYILYQDAWLTDLCTVLKNYTIYTIGIDAPLEILEAREKSRGFTFVEGHVRSHHESVHRLFKQHNGYDLIVNTHELSAKEGAQKIYDYIASTKDPKGFKTVSNRFASSWITQSINFIKRNLHLCLKSA